MIADYISTSYCQGKAFSVFPVAHARVGTALDVAMYANVTGLGDGADKDAPRLSSAGEEPIANIVSDANVGEDAERELERQERATFAAPEDIFSIFPALDFQVRTTEVEEIDVAH